MTTQQEHLIHRTIRERFGGRLFPGKHSADGVACALEAAHAALGEKWSDRPTRWPDIRPLNDACWSSSTLRATWLGSVLAAYWGWARWAPARQQTVITQVILETVRQMIANLPGLPVSLRADCAAVGTLQQAAETALRVSRHDALQKEEWKVVGELKEAAWMATLWTWAAGPTAAAAEQASEAAAVAQETGNAALRVAARAAADAARRAAGHETGAADRDSRLIQACRLWIDATKRQE